MFKFLVMFAGFFIENFLPEVEGKEGRDISDLASQDTQWDGIVGVDKDI